MQINVFIADDHSVVREGLRLLLEAHADMKVVGDAGDGRQAVSDIRQLCPDVVLMDIAMPELNGIEATRQIKDRCPSTQIVILSMYATNEHIFQALHAGALGYLLKESASSEVVTAVRTVHNGRRYLCRKIDETMLGSYLNCTASKVRSPVESLSNREREVLQLVVEGKSSAEIADILSLSPKTVETYRSRLMQKLNIKDIPGLVKFAIQHGLTRPE
jgi:DNA-binding NarL/FixJ family response regulator